MLHLGEEREERRCLHAEDGLSSVWGASEVPWGLLAASLDAGRGTWHITSRKVAVQETWLHVPPWPIWRGGLVKAGHSHSLKKCLWGHLSLSLSVLPFSLHRHGYLSFSQFNELNQFTKGRLRVRAGLREAVRHTSKCKQGREEERSGEKNCPLDMPASR